MKALALTKGTGAPRPSHHAPFDVTTLDDAATLALALPEVGQDAARPGLPAGWTPWRMPPARRPIDIEVARLVKPGDLDTLRLQVEQIDGLGILCPFFAGRQAVVIAARVGRHEARLRDGAGEAGALAAAAADLAERTARLLARLPDDIEAATTPLDRRRDPIASHRRRLAKEKRRAEIVAGMEAMRAELADLDAAREDVIAPGRPGEAWRLGFARSLGFSWFVLSGRKPSATKKDGSRFQSFVTAAYATLAPDDDVNWTRACTRARLQVDGWPAWAGFDWLASAGLPSSVFRMRGYKTMEAARIGGQRETERMLRYVNPLLVETRAAIAANQADREALYVMMADDASPDFGELIRVARRVTAYNRSVMNAAKAAVLQLQARGA